MIEITPEGRGGAVIKRLAAQYGVILMDAWASSTRSDREDWSADGVRLNVRGCFKFAQETLKTLEQPGCRWPGTAGVDARPSGRRPTHPDNHLYRMN